MSESLRMVKNMVKNWSKAGVRHHECWFSKRETPIVGVTSAVLDQNEAHFMIMVVAINGFGRQ